MLVAGVRAGGRGEAGREGRLGALRAPPNLECPLIWADSCAPCQGGRGERGGGARESACARLTGQADPIGHRWHILLARTAVACHGFGGRQKGAVSRLGNQGTLAVTEICRGVEGAVVGLSL